MFQRIVEEVKMHTDRFHLTMNILADVNAFSKVICFSLFGISARILGGVHKNMSFFFRKRVGIIKEQLQLTTKSSVRFR